MLNNERGCVVLIGLQHYRTSICRDYKRAFTQGCIVSIGLSCHTVTQGIIVQKLALTRGCVMFMVWHYHRSIFRHETSAVAHGSIMSTGVLHHHTWCHRVKHVHAHVVVTYSPVS